MWQSWELEISPGLRQAEQEGWVTAKDPEAAPWPWHGFAVAVGPVLGAVSLCPKSTRVLGEWKGWVQDRPSSWLLQGWDGSSSPVGLARVPGQTQLRVASGQTCPDLQPWSPNSSRACKGEIYDFSDLANC